VAERAGARIVSLGPRTVSPRWVPVRIYIVSGLNATHGTTVDLCWKRIREKLKWFLRWVDIRSVVACECAFPYAKFLILR
jgi:hypothetical protein